VVGDAQERNKKRGVAGAAGLFGEAASEWAEKRLAAHAEVRAIGQQRHQELLTAGQEDRVIGQQRHQEMISEMRATTQAIQALVAYQMGSQYSRQQQYSGQQQFFRPLNQPATSQQLPPQPMITGIPSSPQPPPTHPQFAHQQQQSPIRDNHLGLGYTSPSPRSGNQSFSNTINHNHQNNHFA
jgi:hypothetical protein